MTGASIFLVEDEALIRLMLADMIEELGHRVVAEAGNIKVGQALAQAAIFDLAVLDINIAGYSISSVAEIIDGRGLPFLFVTGYGPAGRPEAFRTRPVLHKPETRRGNKLDPVDLNRIGRRTIMCMLLIAALAIVWNVLGGR